MIIIIVIIMIMMIMMTFIIFISRDQLGRGNQLEERNGSLRREVATTPTTLITTFPIINFPITTFPLAIIIVIILRGSSIISFQLFYFLLVLNTVQFRSQGLERKDGTY